MSERVLKRVKTRKRFLIIRSLVKNINEWLLYEQQSKFLSFYRFDNSKIIGDDRRSQDFVWGALFTKKS